jgi:hypothetical protein
MKILKQTRRGWTNRLLNNRIPQARRGGSRRAQINKPNLDSENKSKCVVVKNLHEFVEEITKVKSNNNQDLILFRGQRESDKKLVPKIGRKETRLKRENQSDLPEIEERFLELFKRLSLPFIETKPESSSEWLAIAQHHGLPTRLLDWTANALAALWFVVRKEAGKDKNGAVWILNPTDEDFIPSDTTKELFELERIKIYRPRHITKRLIVQSGYFTVHPWNQITSRFKSLNEDTVIGTRLVEIQIDSNSFSNFRDNLERLGISDLTMFPDLDGICRYITWNNSLLDDEQDFPNKLLNQSE